MMNIPFGRFIYSSEDTNSFNIPIIITSYEINLKLIIGSISVFENTPDTSSSAVVVYFSS